MSPLVQQLWADLQDENARHDFADAFANSVIAAQIKSLREADGLSQQELAEKLGTKQSGVSRLENVNYSSWKVETLRKLARAFDLRLSISFEEFGTLVSDIQHFENRLLLRRKFADDPVFRLGSVEHAEASGPEPSLPAKTANSNLNTGTSLLSQIGSIVKALEPDSGQGDCASRRAQSGRVREAA